MIGIEGGRINVVPVDFVVARDGPSRPSRRPRRADLPPDRSEPAAGRRHAERARQGGARAGLHHAGQRGPVRSRPEGADPRADGADAVPPHAQADDEGARAAGRHLHVRQLPDPVRLPRDPEAPEARRHRGSRLRGLRLAALGLLGAPSRSGAVRRPVAARRGRGQAGARHRRVGRHRQGDRAQAGEGRREDADRRARREKLELDASRSSPSRGSRSRPTAPTFPTPRNARRSSSRSSASTAGSTSSSTTPAVRSAARSRIPTTACTTSSG